MCTRQMKSSIEQVLNYVLRKSEPSFAVVRLPAAIPGPGYCIVPYYYTVPPRRVRLFQAPPKKDVDMDMARVAITTKGASFFFTR